MSFQKLLESLKPYVVGIRFVDNLPVVDAVFKEGWHLPESKVISKTKGDETVNYYMIYSEVQDIGIDELLNYVETIIKVNIEREKKHELLLKKVEELKEVFKKNSLSKLLNLKFVFPTDELLPSLDDISIDPQPEPDLPKIPEEPKPPSQPTHQYTEDELEIIQEEKRAENYKNYKKTQDKKESVKKLTQKIELPPKKNELVPVLSEGSECNCGPNEACEKCIEFKDL